MSAGGPPPNCRGSGTDTLVFGYTVKSNDLDTDGISVLGSWAGNDGAIH